jgi:CheY-like chemotaxis protein
MEVLTAQDGLQALKLLRAQGTILDVNISDIIMPRMVGYQFFMTLSNNFPNIIYTYHVNCLKAIILNLGIEKKREF